MLGEKLQMGSNATFHEFLEFQVQGGGHLSAQTERLPLGQIAKVGSQKRRWVGIKL